VKATAKRGEPLRRFGWLIAIWITSVAGLGIFATLFRLLMSAAGLTTGSP